MSNTITAAEFDRVAQAIGVVEFLWTVEEAFDNVLQNCIEFELDISRINISQQVNVVSLPAVGDTELRLVNRRLLNLLFSARAFIDSISATGSHGAEPISNRVSEFKTLFSREYDLNFSYRLLENLRNYTQHKGVAIFQILTTGRVWRSGDDTIHLTNVSPQIDVRKFLRSDKLQRIVREELSEMQEPTLDLIPHMHGYVKSLSNVVFDGRAIFEEALRESVQDLRNTLGPHLHSEWSIVWLTPHQDPERRHELFTGTHDLERLTAIRLRNAACDPEGATA